LTPTSPRAEERERRKEKNWSRKKGRQELNLRMAARLRSAATRGRNCKKRFYTCIVLQD
jgi:hypothetical protein